MRVAVLGDTLLARTVAECCAPHFTMETTDPDVLWVCIDTPVTDDVPDVDFVLSAVGDALTHVWAGALVLISSQVPVGTCAELERRHPDYTFAVSPENVRRANAVEDFLSQARFVVGARKPDYRLVKLFRPFTDRIEWMSPESAEMVKHAINGYLALCITFANELADVCTDQGANLDDVWRGFRSDQRVGEKAPLRPGEPYTGGTLGRDVHVLSKLSTGPLFGAVQESNARRLP